MTATKARTWAIDEAGRPWLHDKRQRQRGQWRTCPHCSETFPALPRATYCSGSCAVRAWKRPHGRQDAFVEWTPEEAWLAGLIWADGSISRNSRATTSRVRVGSVDSEIIEHASRILDVPISTHTPPAPRRPLYTVSIHGKPVERLASLGLAPGKTYVGGFPDLDALGHADAFVRGFFDGDGSVGLYVNPSKTTQSPRLKSHFVGTEESMYDLREVLVTKAGVRRNKVCRHSRSHVKQLFFNHGDSLRLAEFMYENPGPALSRKRDIFAEGRRILPVPPTRRAS